MLAPVLVARVEQVNSLPGQRVRRGDATALMLVAKRTSQPEVLYFRESTKQFGDNVVDFHGRTNDRLRRLAIATAVTSGCPHLLT